MGAAPAFGEGTDDPVPAILAFDQAAFLQDPHGYKIFGFARRMYRLIPQTQSCWSLTREKRVSRSESASA